MDTTQVRKYMIKQRNSPVEPMSPSRRTKPMTLNDYQNLAAKTASYDDPLYPIVSLMVEAGEFADLYVKPWLRGDDKDVDRKEVVGEAGDVLWNLAMALYDHGITLEEEALYNLQKLKDRQERGVIRGDGGNR